MARTSYPHANTPILTESQWEEAAELWLRSGVVSGELNELEVYADASGMQVKVKTGKANVKARYFKNDAEYIQAIAASDPANPRIDRVILRLDRTAGTLDFAVLQGVAAVTPAAPALTQNAATWEEPLAQVRVNAAVVTIALEMVLDERSLIGNVNTSDLTAGIQVGGTFNEFMWPGYVPNGTSILSGLWLSQIGTPTVLTVNSDPTLPLISEYISCTTDAATEGWAQRYTYASQRRVKSGAPLSMHVPVHITTAGRILTVELRTSAGAVISKTVRKSGGWQVVTLDNLTLDGTYVEARFILDGIGSFTVAPPSISATKRALPLPFRRLRWRDVTVLDVVNGIDPGGLGGSVYTDVDCTASTSPLAVGAQITCAYTNNTSLAMTIKVRRNGDATDSPRANAIVRNEVITGPAAVAAKTVMFDDGQIFEYASMAAAGDSESLFLGIAGFWEWE